MEQAAANPPQEAVRLGTELGDAELLDPITRRELDARFNEIKTRIWITAAGAFLGSFAGGALRAGITPHTAAEAIWRLL